MGIGELLERIAILTMCAQGDPSLVDSLPVEIEELIHTHAYPAWENAYRRAGFAVPGDTEEVPCS